METKGQWTSRI